MQDALLWYDDDKKTTLAQKIKRAADYFTERRGQRPNEVYVNPKMLEDLEDAPTEVDGVKVVPNRTVIVNHFWLSSRESYKPGPQKR